MFNLRFASFTCDVSELLVSFENEFPWAVSGDGPEDFTPLVADCFVTKRHFLRASSISAENYGVGNVEEYADRRSSYGRNKGCSS
jgi:hypothetical protein